MLIFCATKRGTLDTAKAVAAAARAAPGGAPPVRAELAERRARLLHDLLALQVPTRRPSAAYLP